VKLYYCNNCHTCLDKDKCCTTNVRIISAYKNEQIMQRMKTEYEKAENREKHGQRAIVEGNFAHILHNLRFKNFQTTGIEKIQTEANILSFANNTKRTHTIKQHIKKESTQKRTKNSTKKRL